MGVGQKQIRSERVVAAIVLLLVSCRKETLDEPVAPDMSDVLRAFDAPTARLDSATAAKIRSTATDAVNGLVGSGLPQRVLDEAKKLVADAAAKQTSSSLRTKGLEGQGFGRVTRVCEGWDGGTTPDAATNGSLGFTLTFSEAGLDPVLWGDATRCRLSLGKDRIFVDDAAPDVASVRIHLGGTVKPEDIGTLPVVVSLRAHAQIDDKDVNGELAVRVTEATSDVDLLVPVDGGHVVVTIAGTALIRVVATNGTFTCDTAGCNDGTEVVAW
ncbi:MAG: hypothetical protein ACXVEF_42000 [Polyangiales bacterium]